jgi:hypothetical protein
MIDYLLSVSCRSLSRKFDVDFFWFGMFGLGQIDLHDAVPATGRDLVGIDVNRQFQGAGEFAGSEFGAVYDLPFLLDERFAFPADGDRVPQYGQIDIFGSTPGIRASM